MRPPVQTLAQLFLHAWAHCKPDQLVVSERGAYVAISSAELYRRVAQLHLALGKLGVRRGDCCVVLSEGRWERLVADFAMATAGIVGVLLDPAMSSEQIRCVLGSTGARSILVSTNEQRKKVDEIGKRFQVDNVIAIEPGPGGPAVRSSSFTQLIGEMPLSCKEREDFHSSIELTQPEDFATILCCSGTSDAGKGVMLTQGDWLTGLLESDLGIRQKDVVLCFLPRDPVFARTVEYTCLLHGATVVYAETAERALSGLERARPTLVAADPEFFEKLHSQVRRRLVASSSRRRMLHWALQASAHCGFRQFENEHLPEHGRIDLSDPATYSAFQARLGGRVRGFLASAGNLAPELSEFLGAFGLRGGEEINVSLGPRGSDLSH